MRQALRIDLSHFIIIQVKFDDYSNTDKIEKS